MRASVHLSNQRPLFSTLLSFSFPLTQLRFQNLSLSSLVSSLNSLPFPLSIYHSFSPLWPGICAAQHGCRNLSNHADLSPFFNQWLPISSKSCSAIWLYFSKPVILPCTWETLSHHHLCLQVLKNSLRSSQVLHQTLSDETEVTTANLPYALTTLSTKLPFGTSFLCRLPVSID